MSDCHFLDANVPLYAVGASDNYQEACRRILQSVHDGALQVATNVEVFQEIMHLACSRGRIEAGASLVRSLMKLIPEVLPIERRDIEEMVAILVQKPQLSARDALHVAVMRHHHLDTIITADRHFAMIPGIVALDPREVVARLGR